jgi:hypothetical protein
MAQRQLFRVIVVGGASLIGATAPFVNCSGGVPSEAADNVNNHYDQFPSELPSPVDATITDVKDARVDAPTDVVDADTDSD